MAADWVGRNPPRNECRHGDGGGVFCILLSPTFHTCTVPVILSLWTCILSIASIFCSISMGACDMVYIHVAVKWHPCNRLHMKSDVKILVLYYGNNILSPVSQLQNHTIIITDKVPHRMFKQQHFLRTTGILHRIAEQRVKCLPRSV